MKIVLLETNIVIKHWPTLSALLDKVILHGQGESTTEDYLRKILNKEVQCWAVVDGEENEIVGAGLTQVLYYAQHTTLHIIAFSGDNFEHQSQVFHTVEEHAKSLKCKAIEQWGRPGWGKLLPKYVPGFKQTYVVMRKDLQYE